MGSFWPISRQHHTLIPCIATLPFQHVPPQRFEELAWGWACEAIVIEILLYEFFSVSFTYSVCGVFLHYLTHGATKKGAHFKCEICLRSCKPRMVRFPKTARCRIHTWAYQSLFRALLATTAWNNRCGLTPCPALRQSTHARVVWLNSSSTVTVNLCCAIWSVTSTTSEDSASFGDRFCPTDANGPVTATRYSAKLGLSLGSVATPLLTTLLMYGGSFSKLSSGCTPEDFVNTSCMESWHWGKKSAPPPKSKCKTRLRL